MKLLDVLIFVLSCLHAVYSYKILVYSPTYARSHITFMGKIADTLAKAGHEVTVYQPIYEEISSTGTKFAKVIRRPRDFEPLSQTTFQENAWSTEEKGFSEKMNTVTLITSIQSKMCQHQLEDERLMKNLSKENFDIALGEPFDPCFYGILRKIGVETYITTVMSPLPDTSYFGIPSTASFVPIFSAESPPLNYLTRAKNLFGLIMLQIFYPKWFLEPVEKIMKPYFGQDFNTINQIVNSAIVFINVDEHLDYPRPISHKLVYIGGIGQSQPKPLEEKYENLLNSSRRGVILVSFGSVAQSSAMPETMKRSFLETFSKFPDITFLWKYENDEDDVAKGYSNVVTGKWLPQTDLFAHPKLLAFISHGGANSVMEAAYSGVPIICITLHNAPRNAQLVQHRGIGIGLEKKDILQGKLADAIENVITDSNYKESALRLSQMIQSKPMSAEERVVKYTEFAAEFGRNNNLDMHGKDMNFIQFYCLDIILPFLVAIIFVLYFCYKIISFVICRFLKSFIVPKKKTE